MLHSAQMPINVRFLWIAIACILVSGAAGAGTFIVTSTGDDEDLNPGDGVCEIAVGGACTLRAAITEANATGGADDIAFSIDDKTDPGCDSGTGVCVINVATTGGGANSLRIDEQLTIDGSTQPGAADVCTLPIASRPTYRIVLDGDRSDTGLVLRSGSDGSVLRGLNVRNFFSSVVFEETNNSSLECSFIGTDETGMAAGNAMGGNVANGVIFVCDSDNNTVGGVTAQLGNLISGNEADGIQFFGGTSCSSSSAQAADNNQVLGNYIGVSKAGTAVAGLNNEFSGISFFGAAVDPFAGNSVGVSQDGLTRLGNVVSGNGSGIYIEGNVIGTRIEANWIGTASDGMTAAGNSFGGVEIVDASGVSIGGAAAGAGNVIAFNGENGVAVYDETTVPGTPSAVSILGNSMFSNALLGVELTEMTKFDFAQDGADGNDAGDADAGPNGRQNSPVITVSTLSARLAGPRGSMVDIEYSVDSSVPLTVEFFVADVDGEEGQTFLGRDTYAGPSGAPKMVSFPAGIATVTDQILATATDAAGNTSEFGAGALLPVELQSFSIE